MKSVLAAVLMLFVSTAAFAEDEITFELPEADVLAIQQGAEEGEGAEIGHRKGGDSFPSPQQTEYTARRDKAIKAKLAGRASGKVHEVAKGQFVEMALERNDRIFVVLAEYGNGISKVGANPAPNVPATPGPQHNQIPQPDRTRDNATIWQPTYEPAHFEDMYFNRMKKYYETQSSGRYTVNGSVTEWVKVPFNGPRYGNNTSVGDTGAWTLIADAINIWTRDQINSGKSLDEVKAYLRTFDQWDRYDYDKDGVFSESDGYIDHFQIVHAGIGEETDSQGNPNAIWSHRWFAYYNLRGSFGPSYNRYGGLEFGGGWGANPSGSITGATGASTSSAPTTTAANVTWAHPVNATGIWVGDYTIQPENGGLGVFAHEYGHDLSLPDHYDTAGGSNSVAYWSVMASGSYLGDGGINVGEGPGDFLAWDKFHLGWLNYEEAQAGRFSTHKLGPAETNTKQAQAVLVTLPPDKNIFYMHNPATGHVYGVKSMWGGRAHDLDVTMTTKAPIAVPATNNALTMRMWFDLENGGDYAYVSASADNGATWTNLAATGTTTTANPYGLNLGNGITGTTTSTWRLVSFPMTAFANKNVLLRIRYKTDDSNVYKGFAVDEIALGTFKEGFEAGTGAWTVNGFVETLGVEVANEPHYYFAEFRQYRTYDEGLRTGPYVNGTAGTTKWVTHFPYQDGLLITYWDTLESNNNTSAHRGEGRVLPVDAHPESLLIQYQFPGDVTPRVGAWGGSTQAYDSTFGLEPTDAITLPFALSPGAGQPAIQFSATHPSLPAVSVFNDLNPYWDARTSASSVIVPKTGTYIRVVSTSAHDSFMQIQVGASK